jgi:hypothetical protein
MDNYLEDWTVAYLAVMSEDELVDLKAVLMVRQLVECSENYLA